MIINEILNRYINNENRSTGFSQYSTENIINILKHAGNPHEKIKTIHIAGTNGKGTTASIISGILSANGYKTGLYTSPHLLRINERIQIDGKCINDETLEKILIYISETAEKNGISLTYFDVLTAAAFIFFDQENTDFSVIECGLGGRLDTTNIITPMISVITDISFDHENILGNTIELITREKTGIIKNNIASVTSNTDTKIVNIIRNECVRKNSELTLSSGRYSDISFTGDGIKFIYSGRNFKKESIYLKFSPESRIKNTALALTAIDLLSPESMLIDTKTAIESIGNFTLQGRFETGSTDPCIIFDVAHNMHSITELVKTLQLYFKNSEFRIFATFMKDKHPLELIKYLRLNLSEDINYIKLNDERNYKPDDNHNMTVIHEDDIETVIKNISLEKINIFTGSFRLYNIYSKIISAGKDNEIKIRQE
ncbi:MAG: hypothetical protein JW982_15575 [Spirochaetes bacterium]|nr:hypothetical protein [Spirochaetota bacterium]